HDARIGPAPFFQTIVDAGADAADVDEELLRLVGIDHLLGPARRFHRIEAAPRENLRDAAALAPRHRVAIAALPRGIEADDERTRRSVLRLPRLGDQRGREIAVVAAPLE